MVGRPRLERGTKRIKSPTALPTELTALRGGAYHTDQLTKLKRYFDIW